MDENNNQNDEKDKKKIMLMYAGSLLFYCAFGILLALLFNKVLGMEMKSIWMEGFQIGLISWLVVMVLPVFIRKKRR